MASNLEFRIPSLIEARLNESSETLKKIKSELLLLDITQDQANNVVQLFKDLMTENKNSIEYLLNNTETNPQKIVQDVLKHSLKFFESIDTAYKR